MQCSDPADIVLFESPAWLIAFLLLLALSWVAWSLLIAAFARRRSVSKCWRASISVGASIATCAPASTARSMASSATTVLPEPTSPCSRRSIGASCARSPSISSTLRFWAPVSGNGSANLLRRRPSPRSGWPRRRRLASRTSSSASALASSSS